MASELALARPDKNALSPDQGRSTRGDAAGNPPKPQADNTPTQSPWWSAPAGRPVAIPAFGRSVILARSWVEALLDLLLPKPVLVPVKVKAPATRRR